MFSKDPTHGCASAGRPARTYLQQLCTDIGCSLKDLPGAVDDERESMKFVLAAQLDDDE